MRIGDLKANNNKGNLNIKKYIRFVVALVVSPIVIPFVIFSLLVIGIIEGLYDKPFPWAFYKEYHFKNLVKWYRIWD